MQCEQVLESSIQKVKHVCVVLQVVDVNRTSKGARAGRVQGFSALVVVGNQNVSGLDKILCHV